MSYAKRFSLGVLIAALMMTGCGDGSSAPAPRTGTATSPASSSAPADGHAPHGKGPNGGVVFDLGKHHAEFTVDHKKKECAILLLGDDEKTAQAVVAKELTLNIKEAKTKEGAAVSSMTIKMLPQNPTDGKASKFVGSDPGLGGVADFEGTVFAEIDGQPSQGEFKE